MRGDGCGWEYGIRKSGVEPEDRRDGSGGLCLWIRLIDMVAIGKFGRGNKGQATLSTVGGAYAPRDKALTVGKGSV